MGKRIFIQGISTEVGKTLASAIVVESLQSDYFKPVQSGYPQDCDTTFVRQHISNTRSTIHPPGLRYKAALSPHAAAALENREDRLQDIAFPNTNNTLVCEAAGGLLVPLNLDQLCVDLIQPQDHVILVSKHYLGNINHTLLSIEYLQQKGVENIAILFSGNENKATEKAISAFAKVPIIGRINEEALINKQTITRYAAAFESALKAFIHE